MRFECLAISSLLASNHALQLLDLEGNHITDAGIAEIASSFGAEDFSLRTFNMRRNQCSDIALENLGFAIFEHKGMHTQTYMHM